MGGARYENVSFEITEEHRALVALFIATAAVDPSIGVDMAVRANTILRKRALLAENTRKKADPDGD